MQCNFIYLLIEYNIGLVEPPLEIVVDMRRIGARSQLSVGGGNPHGCYWKKNITLMPMGISPCRTVISERRIVGSFSRIGQVAPKEQERATPGWDASLHHF